MYRFVTEGSVEEKIAERAAKKLKMDHLVIQKGALANAAKVPSVQEMNSIVQFGAQQVLKSTAQVIPEEDIDKLLYYSEEKTKEIQEELSKLEEAFDLNSFSFDGSAFYDFEGSNYKEKQKEHISLGTRNRRSTGFYEVDRSSNYHRKQKKKGWRIMIGGGHPFQFFPTEELDELDQKEDVWNQYLNEKTRRRTRGDKSEKPEKFTEDDSNRRLELLEQGFSDWTKREFNDFIKGCESFGRNEIKQIAEEVETKTITEVKDYASVFWSNIDSLPNGKELVEKIEQGERDIARLSHINSVLESKRKRISEGESVLLEGSTDLKYTREEDLYLTNYLLSQGYRDWDALRLNFKTLPQFKFNFWMQSRVAEEIEERCDSLILCMEQIEDSPRKIRKIQETPEDSASVEVTQDYNWIITFPNYPLS